MLKENSGRLKDHTADRYEKSWRLHIPWSQVGQVLAVINHASAATGGGQTSERPLSRQHLTRRDVSFSRLCLREGVAAREVERLIPEASKYLLKKSKQLRKRFGVWERPEPYHGGSISEDTIRAATQYYTDDDLDCSRQSPNKKGGVKLLKDGEEHVVVKRYMTRSVRETYRLFKEANPDSKLGLTKFYSLRPKWVKLNPEQTVCACVCCTNFDLCFSTLNSTR
ncbi:unnamed protein product [Ixodes hexagonus]